MHISLFKLLKKTKYLRCIYLFCYTILGIIMNGMLAQLTTIGLLLNRMGAHLTINGLLLKQHLSQLLSC